MIHDKKTRNYEYHLWYPHNVFYVEAGFTYTHQSKLILFTTWQFWRLEFWDYPFINNVVKFVKRIRSSFIQTGSIRYVTKMYSFVHEASAPQFITSCVANRAAPNVLG